MLLGTPLLNQPSTPVQESDLSAVTAVGVDLHDTLMDFRAKHGWGRAIAAPQIGVLRRIVYLRIDRPWLIINPAMDGLSEKMVELWDDCMSFPDLLVRVKRHSGFTLAYRDEHWVEHTLTVEGVLSELLQHELDHLAGVLAVSRAVDGASFALRSQRHLLIGAPALGHHPPGSRPSARPYHENYDAAVLALGRADFPGGWASFAGTAMATACRIATSIVPGSSSSWRCMARDRHAPFDRMRGEA